jgi:orotidine-5'-phosphate decarboxylase
MAEMFGERLVAAVRETGNCAVVGLDPHLDRFPAHLLERYQGRTGAEFRKEAALAVVAFNRLVIESVRGVVADAKRGDISSTAAAYARSILASDGPFHCDSVTVNPWMGPDTLDPFIEVCGETGGGIFVLVRTTNPGSAWLQHHGDPTGAETVACMLAQKGEALTGPSGMSSIGAVVGAMTGDEAAQLRTHMPGAWFLVPGVGAQGGSEKDAIAGLRSDAMGCLVNSSRGVLYPPSTGRSEYDSEPGMWISKSAKEHAERFKFDV